MLIPARYYDGQSSIAYNATAELWSDRLYVITAHGKYDWFLEKTNIVEHASRDISGKFSNDDFPDAQLLIDNPEEFHHILQKLPKKKVNIKYRMVFSFALSAALLIFAIFYIVPALSPALANHVPKSWEKNLGTYVTHAFTATEKVCRNEKATAHLQKIIDVLTSGKKYDYKFRASVIQEDEANAFAAPGGNIIILSGLIDDAKTESELDGVLAHEIGHAVHRHGMEHLTRTLMTTFIIDVLTGGGGTMIYLGQHLLESSYSRDAEEQADNFALELLARKRITPEGLYNFLERASKEADGLDDDLEFLSTHPSTKHRMREVKAKIHDKQYYNILTLQEWNELKAICR